MSKHMIKLQLFANDGEDAELEEDVEVEEEDIELDEEDLEEDLEDDKEPPATEPTVNWEEKYKELEKEKNKLEEDFKYLHGAGTDSNINDLIDQAKADEAGISLEEYRKQRETKRLAELGKQQEILDRYNAQAAKDLTELKKVFPHLTDVKDIKNIENFEYFGKLRDRGLSPEEAYKTANFDMLQGIQPDGTKGSKKHLKPTGKQGNKGSGAPVPNADELASWRIMFPNKSDKEIIKIYQKSALE